MGVTGYWFNKEYDGLRSVWTNKNTQVRIGVGTFKHSTGISDSAYTHAIYTHFKRVPTVEEFLGVTMDSDGANKELIVPNAGNTINFYQKLKALRDKEGALDAEVGTLKKKIDDMTSDIWSKEFIDGMSADQLAPLKAELAKLEASLPDVEARVAKEREPLRAAQFDVLRRMQEIAVKAYGADAAKQTVSIKMPDVSVTYSYKSRYYDEDDEQWYEDERTFTQKIAPGTIGLDKKNPLFEMKLSDTSVLAKGGKPFISNWYNQNKAAIVEAYRAKAKDIATYSFGNNPYTMKFEDNAFDGLDKSIYKANVVDINDSGTSGLINVKGSAYYPSMIASYFNSLARMLEKADGNSRLPREALGKYTGAVIPSIGVVLERDTIPPIEKATYVQVKHMVTPRLGLAAWYLRSFGGSD